MEFQLSKTICVLNIDTLFPALGYTLAKQFGLTVECHQHPRPGCTQGQLYDDESLHYTSHLLRSVLNIVLVSFTLRIVVFFILTLEVSIALVLTLSSIDIPMYFSQPEHKAIWVRSRMTIFIENAQVFGHKRYLYDSKIH